MELNQLSAEVQSLPLGALQVLVGTLLAREGFGEIEIFNRWKSTQKSLKGGFELMCTRGIGPIQQTTLIKVIQDDIRVRMVAELAGNVDRMHADYGIVLSTKRACHTTVRELPNFTKSPIYVMEIHDLVQMLIDHNIGVRPWGEPDYAYFSLLRETALDAEEATIRKKRMRNV